VAHTLKPEDGIIPAPWSVVFVGANQFDTAYLDKTTPEDLADTADMAELRHMEALLAEATANLQRAIAIKASEEN
jgi:hypothetical protein